MTESLIDKIKERASITAVVEHFGGLKVNSKGKALCPFHKEKTPSFSVKESEHFFKCFGCGESGDVIDFVAKIKGVSTDDAITILADYCGIERAARSVNVRVDRKPAPPTPTRLDANLDAPAQAKKANTITDASKEEHKAYIKRCIADIGKTDYLKKERGFSDETIARFFLGYDTQKDGIVIPYSRAFDYQITRLLHPPNPDKPFLKPLSAEWGSEPIFNGSAIVRGGVVFVVESQLCAISIAQAGGTAVALGGTSGVKNFVSEVKAKNKNCIFVLALDNDPSGEKAQRDLANLLFEENARFIPLNIMDECKDPNDLLKKDAARLAKNIQAAVTAAKEKYRTEQDAISFAELCRKKLPPLRWAIKGLFPEGLHMIASMPKVGKSWMALGMCFAIANGTDYLGYQTTRMGTLYYSLEDNYNSAQGRMLDYAKAVGSSPPENAYVAIDAQQTDTGFFAKLKQELSEHPDIGFVVIDTLQNIRGKEIKKGDVYGNDVGELKKIKKFAIENKLVMVLIHHLRKAKDEGDSFNNILGSNGLWGTVDTGITLTKKNEEDAEAKMRFKGRGIKPGELIITLDSCRWEIVGTPEQQEAMRKKSEYDDNSVIKTIKWLVSKIPYSWSGTPTELMMASFDMDGVAKAISQESVGKTINKHKMDLYYDGISVEDKRTSKKRIYAFYKKAYGQKQFRFNGDEKE